MVIVAYKLCLFYGLLTKIRAFHVITRPNDDLPRRNAFDSLN